MGRLPALPGAAPHPHRAMEGLQLMLSQLYLPLIESESKGWKAGRRAERPPDSMRAGPSKKELQKSVKEMKLTAVDMGGSRMSDDI